jgi:hypothetical protein
MVVLQRTKWNGIILVNKLENKSADRQKDNAYCLILTLNLEASSN